MKRLLFWILNTITLLSLAVANAKGISTLFPQKRIMYLSPLIPPFTALSTISPAAEIPGKVPSALNRSPSVPTLEPPAMPEPSRDATDLPGGIPFRGCDRTTVQGIVAVGPASRKASRFDQRLGRQYPPRDRVAVSHGRQWGGFAGSFTRKQIQPAAI